MDTNTTTAFNAATATPIQEGKDTNTFRPYNPELGAPELSGFRNVKIIYRENKRTGEKAGETSYIRVKDYITEQLLADNMEFLMPYFIGFIQGQEDELIKAAHKDGATGYDGGLAAVLSYMEQNNTSSRLNGERISVWFQEEMSEPLALALAEKLGIGEEPSQAQMEKLLNVVGVYEAKLKSLASPKTHYRPEEAERLKRALEVTGADRSYIGGRFKARLEGMKESPAEELLMSL